MVGAEVRLFLGGAWARAVVKAVRPQTEKHAGTPLRRSVRPAPHPTPEPDPHPNPHPNLTLTLTVT